MTSDERREVAENLRDIDEAWPTLVEDLEEDPLRFGGLAMAGILACVDDRTVFRRLADLIDPTCEMHEVGGWPDATSWACSCCGHRLTVRGEHVDFGLAYCPNCGARVVSGDE